MKITFIGLGNMGAPMALNLLAAGHEVHGFDVSGNVPEGIIKSSSVGESVADSNAVITMLPNGHILREIYDEIVSIAPDGCLFLDCSTVDVESARLAANLAIDAGKLAVDAPVSGGTIGAKEGTLTFMTGGDENALTQAEPILSIMGQRTVKCGSNGAGQAAKTCNNMILGITMIATSEAFVLADKLNLDRAALYDVVSTSSGQSWSLTTYCPAPGVGPTTPADNNYQPGFSASLMLKDLELSQQAAWASNAATPLGARAAELYRDFVAENGAEHDFSAIINMLGKMEAVS